jgi:glutathionylspermidine synthase
VLAGGDRRGFRERRIDFHRRLSERWPHGLADPFDLLGSLPLTRPEIAALHSAGTAIARIYLKVARAYPSLPNDVLRAMGHSRKLRRLCLNDRTRFSLGISRIDVAVTESGIKLLDYNADAPGLIFEAAEINQRVCDAERNVDPNHSARARLRAALHSRIRAFRRTRGERRDGAVAVRCVYTREPQDARALAEFYTELCSDRFDAKAISLRELSADDQFVYDDNGDVVDVLIRCTSLSSFLDSRDLSAETGRRILQLVSRGRLCMVNPLRAGLLESKGIQALVWGMFERKLFFDREERSIIKRHFLPTYFAPPPHWRRWVEKPLMESSGVGVVVRTRTERRPTARAGCICQRYAPLKQRLLMTELGPRRLTPVVSCVIVQGRTIALAMRAGKPITDERAWVVPVHAARAPRRAQG